MANIRIENALIELALMARPAPGTVPTPPTTSSVLCSTESLEIDTEIDERATKSGCGTTLYTYGSSSGKMMLQNLTPHTGWNYQSGSGATPEGMAVYYRYKENSSLSAWRTGWAVIKTWKGALSTQSDTVENVELTLIAVWA